MRTSIHIRRTLPLPQEDNGLAPTSTLGPTFFICSRSAREGGGRGSYTFGTPVFFGQRNIDAYFRSFPENFFESLS